MQKRKKYHVFWNRTRDLTYPNPTPNPLTRAPLTSFILKCSALERNTKASPGVGCNSYSESGDNSPFQAPSIQYIENITEYSEPTGRPLSDYNIFLPVEKDKKIVINSYKK